MAIQSLCLGKYLYLSLSQVRDTDLESMIVSGLIVQDPKQTPIVSPLLSIMNMEANGCDGCKNLPERIELSLLTEL